jgi:hypothetical protein
MYTKSLGTLYIKVTKRVYVQYFRNCYKNSLCTFRTTTATTTVVVIANTYDCYSDYLKLLACLTSCNFDHLYFTPVPCPLCVSRLSNGFTCNISGAAKGNSLLFSGPLLLLLWLQLRLLVTTTIFSCNYNNLGLIASATTYDCGQVFCIYLYLFVSASVTTCNFYYL